MPNIAAMQKRCESLIRRWGRNQQGQIMRNGVARASAYMALSDYTPRERGLFLDGSCRIAVSAVGLDSIDFEQDSIRFLDKNFAINTPPTGGRPDGTIVFHDCNVIRLKT